MSFPPASADLMTQARRAADDAEFYREVLHELIGMGSEIARQVHSQIAVQLPNNQPTPDVTVPFERIARCIRHSIVLARKVMEPVPERPAERAAYRRSAARVGIIRSVGDAILRDASDTEAAGLRGELAERMDRPEMDDEIDHRPIQEIIDEIRADLGIGAGAVSRVRRTPADVAALQAWGAAACGTGFGCPGDGAEPAAPADRLCGG
jgi:hypothetical protein